jgi:2,4-dichlorophenol 6-monooxygenase
MLPRLRLDAPASMARRVNKLRSLLRRSMTKLETEVLIAGSGPAGLAAALALSTYGVRVLLITRYSWLAHTPRAHVTNQRTFEIFRDLGIEAEVNLQATPYADLPDVIFCTSLAGEELGRLRSLGNGARHYGDYLASSPCKIADIPQDLLEPILLGKALSRGANIRFNTEYLSSVQDEAGVTSTLRDRISGEQLVVRAKYLIGADGGNSRVAAELELPMEGQMSLSASHNILFEADLAPYTAHRPAFLYFLPRAGANGVELSILRTIRLWNRWLFIKGYSFGRESEQIDDESAVALLRDYLGLPDLAITIKAIDPWKLNSMYATRYRKGRIFCAGDAVHRHVPSNGLGSNTSIQDSYNLAWKLAFVLRGKAHPSLLDTYDDERVPVGRQVVERATKSIQSYTPVLDALDLADAQTAEEGVARMESLKSATAEGATQRERLRNAIAGKTYEFNAHGVEMNHNYRSSAILDEGERPAPPSIDAELFYIPSTSPGARLPHAWLQKKETAVSTLDLVGKGRFSILTGIGGDVWIAAAAQVSKRFDLPIDSHAIGFGCAFIDPYAEWHALRGTEESGCLLVRPDAHVAWRAHKAPRTQVEATTALADALGKILGRTAAVHDGVNDREDIDDRVETAQRS